MQVDAVLDTRSIDRALKKVPGRMAKGLAAAFRKHGQAFRTAMVQQAGQSGEIGVRTGALRRSVRTRTRTSNDPGKVVMTALVGGGLSYAGIQEHGGTIRPRNGKYLTVPLPTALGPGGVVQAKYASVRQILDTGGFIAKSKAGNLIVFEKLDGGQINPLYVLKESVTVPARLKFVATFNSPAMRENRNFWINKAAKQALEVPKS